MSFEQILENRDAQKKSMDFMEQVKIVKQLTEKYAREKNISRLDAQKMAWERVRNGSYMLEDYEDEKPQETKVHSVSERKIGLVSDEKAKLLKIYDLVRKICKKNNNDNYKKLEKYFVNLNKKVH
jgi:hypothetical protein